MKMYLISDNVDTLAGLRMVGIPGIVLHEEAQLRAAIEEASADEELGLILITSKLFNEYSHTIFSYKLHQRRPLIVEMPDRHSGDDVAANIRRYIAESVGIHI